MQVAVAARLPPIIARAAARSPIPPLNSRLRASSATAEVLNLPSREGVGMRAAGPGGGRRGGTEQGGLGARPDRTRAGPPPPSFFTSLSRHPVSIRRRPRPPVPAPNPHSGPSAFTAHPFSLPGCQIGCSAGRPHRAWRRQTGRQPRGGTRPRPRTRTPRMQGTGRRLCHPPRPGPASGGPHRGQPCWRQRSGDGRPG